MKLQTLSDIEQSFGGRPKSSNPKVRHSFYLNQEESELLKEYAIKNDFSVSEMVRRLIRPLIKSMGNK
jgi:hypothetical protein